MRAENVLYKFWPVLVGFLPFMKNLQFPFFFLKKLRMDSIRVPQRNGTLGLILVWFSKKLNSGFNSGYNFDSGYENHTWFSVAWSETNSYLPVYPQFHTHFHPQKISKIQVPVPVLELGLGSISSFELSSNSKNQTQFWFNFEGNQNQNQRFYPAEPNNRPTLVPTR